MEFDEILSEHWKQEESESTTVHRVDVAIRAVYSVFCLVIIGLLESLLMAIVVFQLLYSLISERLPSPRVQSFANSLVSYFYQLLRYVTHNDKTIPFPFSDFPEQRDPTRPAYGSTRSKRDEPMDPCDGTSDDEDER